MLNHQTILSLRFSAPGVPDALPSFGHFRDVHFVRNVMEAKQFLLRCLRGMHRAGQRTPDVILVDAGRDNSDIKTELGRWLSAHPRLGRIKIIFPKPRSWIVRGVIQLAASVSVVSKLFHRNR